MFFELSNRMQFVPSPSNVIPHMLPVNYSPQFVYSTNPGIMYEPLFEAKFGNIPAHLRTADVSNV